LRWSKKEFWESSPRELWSCYYQHAILKNWIKTKEQVEDEKERRMEEELKKLDALL